jgi:hypothetical protein
MLTPDESIPLLSERPLPRTCIARAWARRVRKAVETWLPRRLLALRYRRLKELIVRVQRVENRGELEAIMGRPVYALDGTGYKSVSRSGDVFRPDRVEVYHKDHYILEVEFFKGEMRAISGWVE